VHIGALGIWIGCRSAARLKQSGKEEVRLPHYTKQL
jgi:hypothetical protein